MSAIGAPLAPAPTPDAVRAAAWQEVGRVAALLAIDGALLGGVVIEARPSAALDRWLEGLTALAGPTALRRMPPTITSEHLFGYLDLAATLTQGRPVHSPGLLARADGGLVIVPGSERIDRRIAGSLANVLDQAGYTAVADGRPAWQASRIGIVAIDESDEPGGATASALADRLAFHVRLDAFRLADLAAWPLTSADIAAARARLAVVAVDDDVIASVCAAAVKLAIASPRAPILTIRVARALAALAGLDRIGEAEAREAARLVLAPRATRMPEEQEAEPPPPDQQPDPPPEQPPSDQDEPPTDQTQEEKELEAGDLLVEAVKAALPADVLASLALAARPTRAPASAGRAGPRAKSGARGRPVGTRPGRPERGARLDLIATLRAAAPWQRLRRSGEGEPSGVRRVLIRRDDFRIQRFEENRSSLTIFVVDASGSAALHRLGEAKGAVELMLARCYVRRDHVALVTFRDKSADLALPPTRALARARRALAGLPGGGGTPLANALDVARDIAVEAYRRGQQPIVVLLTDCRVNVARDGRPGRPLAEQDALASARSFALDGIDTLLIDTSPRPHAFAPSLRTALAARYLHLPNAQSEALAASAALFSEASARSARAPSRV